MGPLPFSPSCRRGHGRKWAKPHNGGYHCSRVRVSVDTSSQQRRLGQGRAPNSIGPGGLASFRSGRWECASGCTAHLRIVGESRSIGIAPASSALPVLLSPLSAAPCRCDSGGGSAHRAACRSGRKTASVSWRRGPRRSAIARNMSGAAARTDSYRFARSVPSAGESVSHISRSTAHQVGQYIRVRQGSAHLSLVAWVAEGSRKGLVVPRGVRPHSPFRWFECMSRSVLDLTSVRSAAGIGRSAPPCLPRSLGAGKSGEETVLLVIDVCGIMRAHSSCF